VGEKRGLEGRQSRKDEWRGEGIGVVEKGVSLGPRGEDRTQSGGMSGGRG